MTTNAAPEIAVGTYTVDPSHSSVGFAVRHLGFSKVRGSFQAFEGSVTLDPSDLSTLGAEATIETASITTGDEKRDAHLRSDDFFAAETHPTLTFRATGVRDVASETLTLVGDLTMRGVTREVELDVVYLGEARDPWGGERVAFEARTVVNRKDYGLNWNAVLETGGFLVADEVEIILEVQAVRA
jgi:polyisoprenoid-binding protein YceI